jgi:hypothetical protein
MLARDANSSWVPGNELLYSEYLQQQLDDEYIVAHYHQNLLKITLNGEMKDIFEQWLPELNLPEVEYISKHGHHPMNVMMVSLCQLREDTILQFVNAAADEQVAADQIHQLNQIMGLAILKLKLKHLEEEFDVVGNRRFAEFVTLLSENLSSKTNKIILDHYLMFFDKIAQHGKPTIEDVIQSCHDLELKLSGKPPLSPLMHIAICGVIGAIVGFVLGVFIGALVSLPSGGFGAVPGAMLGSLKGYNLGTSIGLMCGVGVGSLAGLHGLFNGRKRHIEYQARKEAALDPLIKEAINKVDTSLKPFEYQWGHHLLDERKHEANHGRQFKAR